MYARLIKERPPWGGRLRMQATRHADGDVLRAQHAREPPEGDLAKHRSSRDFTLGSLTRWTEIIANFPVYRTYVGEDQRGVSERDREFIA